MINKIFCTRVVITVTVACSIAMTAANDTAITTPATTTEPATLFSIGFGSDQDDMPGKPRYPSGIAFDGHQSLFVNDFADLYEYTLDGKLSHRVTTDRYAGRAFGEISASHVILSQAGVVTERHRKDEQTMLSVDKRQPILAIYNRTTKTWAAIEVPPKWASHYPLRFGEGQIGALTVSETSPVDGLIQGLLDKSMPSHASWRVRIEPGLSDTTSNLTIHMKSLINNADAVLTILVPNAMVVQDVRPIAREGDFSYYLFKYSYQREGDVDHFRAAMLRIDVEGEVDLALPLVDAVYPSYCVQPIAFMGNDTFLQIVLNDTKEELTFLKWGYDE